MYDIDDSICSIRGISIYFCKNGAFDTKVNGK